MGFYFIFCEKKFLLSRENDDFIILLKKKASYFYLIKRLYNLFIKSKFYHFI